MSVLIATMYLCMCMVDYCHVLLLLCREFQQEYQTYFRHSFRVCDYLSKEDARLRDLLNACQGIKVSLSLSTECSPVCAHIHVYM